jgi:hypothetical protein
MIASETQEEEDGSQLGMTGGLFECRVVAKRIYRQASGKASESDGCEYIWCEGL